MVMPNTLEDILSSSNPIFTSKAIALSANTICPEISVSDYTCMASLFGLVIDERRYSRYCGQDNYDDCPMYLGKSLRLYRCKKEF